MIIDHTLNHWEWPFKYFESMFNRMPNFDKSVSMDKYRWQRGVMRYIHSKTTEFERLQYHNVEYRQAMTEKEYFEWFYTDYQLPMPEAAIRLLKSLYDRENGN